MKTVVYIEVKDNLPVKNSLELISAARKLGEVEAVVLNQDEAAKAAAGYGVKVTEYKAESDSSYAQLAALEDAAKEADAVLLPASLNGKDLAGRLAARLGSGAVTDVLEIEAGEKPQFKRPLYGGTVYETLEFAEGKKVVATVRSGCFAKPEAGEGSVSVKELAAVNELVKAVEKTVDITEEVNLEDADIVVAGGRGCADPETFKLVEELANVLGGVVGASRPAIEAGLVSRAHQVGQSGKNIAPKLYIACGISGAMQHVSGIANADFIVAVNKDEDAPIFEIADAGIVGRCEDILPLMIETIKQRKNG